VKLGFKESKAKQAYRELLEFKEPQESLV